mgnify:CR=1 FL=1
MTYCSNQAGGFHMQSVAEQLETIKKNFEKQKQALVAQGEKYTL